MSWRELETAEGAIARLGRERLKAVGVAFLGTLREDGWPRISPVEAHVVQGELLIGVMPRSLKARDLARDPRCTLQSAVTDPHSGEGELKLYARAVGVHDVGLRDGAPEAWWFGRRPEDVRLYALRIERAGFVSWEIERGEMTVRSWSREHGVRTATHPYP